MHIYGGEPLRFSVGRVTKLVNPASIVTPSRGISCEYLWHLYMVKVIEFILSMDLKRLEVSRLFHRFAFGPRPGEFAAALNLGPANLKDLLLNPPPVDLGSQNVPIFSDLGPRPAANSPAVKEFSQSLRSQSKELTTWWLNQMVLTEKPLQEQMVWFWHGHWATSIGKVNYPLPMLKQNQTFRKYALGNFRDLSQVMLLDGALQIWLDGNENTLKAPNENLAREVMELFTLGVGRYSESDVKELARALTGYQVVRSTGVVTLNQRRRDKNPVAILGKSTVMGAPEAISHIVDQTDCARFLAERLWFRFISSSESMPKDHPLVGALANLEISQGLKVLINSQELLNLNYSMVKSPVEWFVAVCKALELVPSKLDSFTKLNNYLEKMVQIPFSPPNVGGWPTDEAWLSSASAQFRISFATWLVKQADLSDLGSVASDRRISYLADLLAVPEWTPRTSSALYDVRTNLPRLVTLAICSPEYVVSR